MSLPPLACDINKRVRFPGTNSPEPNIAQMILEYYRRDFDPELAMEYMHKLVNGTKI